MATLRVSLRRLSYVGLAARNTAATTAALSQLHTLLRSRTFSGARRALNMSAPTLNQSHSDGDNIVVEPEREHKDESIDTLRRRLLYQSRKRGIKEIDLLFSTFCDRYLDSMTPEELAEYDIILNNHDNEWDMLAWLTGKEELPDYLKNSTVMHKLMDFTKNSDREMRNVMPPLR